MNEGSDTRVLFLGLDGFEVLAATNDGAELLVLIQTTADRAFCRTCGVQAAAKGRARVIVRDVPIGDRPVRLSWRKRVWRCQQSQCPAGSWRETSTEIRPRVVLTERARRWALRRVGKDGLPVATVAAELGVSWHTINAAVLELGAQMLADDGRLDGVRAIGLDEHNFRRGSFRTPTSWVTGFVDLDTGRLLDVVENRTAAAVTTWISQRPLAWREHVTVAAMDPYQGYALALRRALPHAQIVVDHWHMIRLANQALDEVRRRTQQDTLGHRGRKGDPLYDVRKLLLVARHRLTDRAAQRIDDAFRHGDPHFEVECAWVGKELLRDVYAASDLDTAAVRLDEMLAWADEVSIPELTRLASTVRHWRHRVLAYHHGGVSNARSEAMNLLAKKVKRIGFGFRNFDNYRMRLLLHCGVVWNTAPTAKIRGRAPSLVA